MSTESHLTTERAAARRSANVDEAETRIDELEDELWRAERDLCDLAQRFDFLVEAVHCHIRTVLPLGLKGPVAHANRDLRRDLRRVTTNRRVPKVLSKPPPGGGGPCG